MSVDKYLVNKPLSAAGISEDNGQGWKIVRKRNSWPRSEASRATVKFWGQSFSRGHRGLFIFYNPPNNFCGLSLDKTDHGVENRTMDIRRYTPSDLISVVWFYFDGRKTKKRANDYAKLWIGQGKPKKTFSRSQWRINKKPVDNSVPRNTKKTSKYAGTIYERSPWEIIRRIIK